MKGKLFESQSLQTFLTAGDFSSAIKHMNLWNYEQLACFLSSCPRMLEKFRSPEFDDFWKGWLENKLRLPNNPDFRFMSQPGIKDADLVMGYILYLFELMPKEKKDEKMKEGTGEQLSIHSVRRQLHSIYAHLDQTGETELEYIARILYNLEAFAKAHQCPGYLLLAYGYLRLALRYQVIMHNERCTAAFQLCWKYLHLAALSEPHSVASINNAYFGQGLVLSTPFGLDNIAEMKQYCRKKADDFLPLHSQEAAEKDARLVYEHVKKQKDLAIEVRPSSSLGM